MADLDDARMEKAAAWTQHRHKVAADKMMTERLMLRAHVDPAKWVVRLDALLAKMEA